MGDTISAFLIWNSITWGVFCDHYNPFKMASTTGVNSFNKSKEDFIWFIKKATSDRKTDAHSELYHSLLKMFVDADTNFDGLVSKESFSKLIDKAASIPRAYGYAPPDSELYKTEEEKNLARTKMFESMDLKSTGVSPLTSGTGSVWSTLLPRLLPLLLTPSLIMATRINMWSSSRRRPLTCLLQRTWSCTGSWWSSSQTLTSTRMASSPRGPSLAWLVNWWRRQSSMVLHTQTRK